VLARRCVSAACKVPEAAVAFVAPLRTGRGHVPRGSQLLDRQTLRRLTSWARGAPRLAIVLVDEDGQAGRRSTLYEHLAGLSAPPLRVVAVARQEFEAWLIADLRAVAPALGFSPDEPGAREALPPRRAKELLHAWIEQSGASGDPAFRRRVRMDLARAADLDILAALESFRRFTEDLSNAGPNCTVP
jgi:hypothetical protein